MSLGPTAWADLGCGDGTFTRALAEVLASRSIVHAIDRDARALADIPTHHNDVQIETYLGDFTEFPWPVDNLDGVLMANSLHYVKNQAAFIASCGSQMKPAHGFLIVEYDTDRSNVWVPYPIGRRALATLFEAAGYATITILGSRPSVYQRAPLYAAMVS